MELADQKKRRRLLHLSKTGRRRLLVPTAFFLAVIYYEELFMKLFCFHSLSPAGAFFTLLFSIPVAVLLGLLYKELTLKNVMQGCKETVTTTASIMLIVAAATCFSWILTKEQIPQQFSQWMISNIHNKYVFLIMVNIFLLIVGMFIEGNASMIVLAPLLHPVAMAYGIDDIHFAMVYIFNCTIGAFTPPMGTLMFVSCGITKCPTKDFIKEAVPFYILFAIDIIVLTYIPQLTTFLVNVFY